MRGGAKEERETDSPGRGEPDKELGPTDPEIMSSAEIRHLMDLATKAPLIFFLKANMIEKRRARKSLFPERN